MEMKSQIDFEMDSEIDKQYLEKIDTFYQSYIERIKKEEPKTKVFYLLNDHLTDLDLLAQQCCQLLQATFHKDSETESKSAGSEHSTECSSSKESPVEAKRPQECPSLGTKEH
jgi:hypothetical protein